MLYAPDPSLVATQAFRILISLRCAAGPEGDVKR